MRAESFSDRQLLSPALIGAADVVLLDRLEGVLEVEVRDLAAEGHTGNTGEVVVQPCPDTGVDDFLPQIVRHVEVPYRVQVIRRTCRVEAVNIEVDMVSP